MNENTRTGAYIVVALVVGALAYATAPASVSIRDDVRGTYPPGTKLFHDIKPGQIKALEIQRYDEKLAKKSTFKVAVKGKKWVIPSHGDYLADAQKQLENITKALVSAELYEDRSFDKQDHETYGVVDPSDLKDGEVKKGVGTLISAMDDSGKVIAKVIVGIPESGAKQEEEKESFAPPSAAKEQGRFLRIAEEEATKVGNIDLDVFSTEFAKWIEADLLQLNAFDVSGVDIRDYAILRAQDARGNVRPFLEMRSENSLALDPNGKWAPTAMSVFKDNDSIEQPLADDEEINNEQLNQLKTAVDDLKIVDVEAKPEGIGDLVVNYDANSGDKLDQETLQELVSRGYYPNPKAGIMGANGEVRVSMKDGIDYLLRFGETKGLSEGADKKLNRYLMVTAQFNPDAVPRPVLAPVPPSAEGPSESDEGEEAATDETKAADASKEGEAKEGDSSEAEKRLAAERQRIIKDNKRKQEEYVEKIKLGKAKVKELNNRFRDWFYVISDDVYRKIHLDRRKIVKLNPNAKEKSYTVEAFHELEKEGIEIASPPPPAPPRTRP
jgi:hypothetical protein